MQFAKTYSAFSESWVNAYVYWFPHNANLQFKIVLPKYFGYLLLLRKVFAMFAYH